MIIEQSVAVTGLTIFAFVWAMSIHAGVSSGCISLMDKEDFIKTSLAVALISYGGMVVVVLLGVLLAALS